MSSIEPTPPQGASTPAVLPWVDPAALAATSAVATLPDSRLVPAVGRELVPRRRRRAPWIGPLVTVLVLGVVYFLVCAVYPLSATRLTVTPAPVAVSASVTAPITWPMDGSSALAAVGADTVLRSNDDVASIASITKIIPSLVIIEKLGLKPGDDGPTYSFTQFDQDIYQAYVDDDQSALDVPVDGSLTTHQMLEGIMLGSANNYVDYLVNNMWPNFDAYLADARAWLERNGLTDITVVDPSGISEDNTATAAALIPLAEKALADPVLGPIMATPMVNLPGAGDVENSNPLINDPGVIGLKTGTLNDIHNLLAAKQVTVGNDTVTLMSVVLGQPTEDDRTLVSRTLLDQAAASLVPTPAVAAGTVVGSVRAVWGAQVDVVTSDEADLLPWQDATGTLAPDISVEVHDAAGADAGTATVTGPLNQTQVSLETTAALTPPSLWWRLTHPFDLVFG